MNATVTTAAAAPQPPMSRESATPPSLSTLNSTLEAARTVLSRAVLAKIAASRAVGEALRVWQAACKSAPTVQTPCKWCGKGFVHLPYRRIWYCSRQCSYNAQRARGALRQREATERLARYHGARLTAELAQVGLTLADIGIGLPQPAAPTPSGYSSDGKHQPNPLRLADPAVLKALRARLKAELAGMATAQPAAATATAWQAAQAKPGPVSGAPLAVGAVPRQAKQATGDSARPPKRKVGGSEAG